MSIDKEAIEGLLSGTGIVIDGPEPWDIHIKNTKFYNRVLRDGSIGLGESYVEGWWDCDALDTFFCKLFSKQIEKDIHNLTDYMLVLNGILRSSLLKINDNNYGTVLNVNSPRLTLMLR